MKPYDLKLIFGTSYKSTITVSAIEDGIIIEHIGNGSEVEKVHITENDVDILIEMLKNARRISNDLPSSRV